MTVFDVLGRCTPFFTWVVVDSLTPGLFRKGQNGRPTSRARRAVLSGTHPLHTGSEFHRRVGTSAERVRHLKSHMKGTEHHASSPVRVTGSSGEH